MPDLWSGGLYRSSTELCNYIMGTKGTMPPLQDGNQVPLGKAKPLEQKR